MQQWEYFIWADTDCVALCYYYTMSCALLVVSFHMSWGILPCFRSSWQNLDWRCRGLQDNEKLPEVFAELMGLWAITYSWLFINCEILHVTFQGFICSWHYRPTAGGRHLAEMGCFWGYLPCDSFPGIIVIQFPAGLKRRYLHIQENFTFCF